MADFKIIPPNVLEEVDRGVRNVPTVYYYSRFAPLRWFFWSRIKLMASLIPEKSAPGKAVLDLGGGTGIFLPTLAGAFGRVLCLDLDCGGASKIKEHYGLQNVQLEKGNILEKDYPGAFDCIVAADVLEHFRDLEAPIAKIESWLKPGGLLLVSGPKENWMQHLGRIILRLTPPPDHYHTVDGIEKVLVRRGFRVQKKIHLPYHLGSSLVGFFSIATILTFKKPSNI